MAQIHHLDHGWITPTASYLLSVLGSLLGLVCAIRFRSAPSTGGRVWWLVLAAVAIGGTGIWTMHFVAMLGFSVVGLPIRYDVGLTAASAVLAVVAVGVGFAVALLGQSARTLRIVIGGLLAGLGVAAMHYTGMAAMELDGTIHYGSARVAISVVIAVVAAIVALWLALNVKGTLAILASAAIMGIAVNGMHFTGMSAMSVTPRAVDGPGTGASATGLLIPIGLAVVFGILGLVYALMAAPTDDDRAGAAYLASRLGAEGTAAPSAPAPVFGFPAADAARPGTQAEPIGSDAKAAKPDPGPEFPGGAGTTIPQQPDRRGSGLNGGRWTYRDRAQNK
jgi:NO-binding membrane sensor protein with MHYT domain